MRFFSRTPLWARLFPLLGSVALAACQERPAPDRARVSGQVEATDVHVSSQVAGRLLRVEVSEGQRVATGDVIARLDAADAELALRRTLAERDQAEAQLRLLLAGSRQEDVRQADAQVAAAEAEVAAAAADLTAAEQDVERFEALLASNSGSRKQRDDAVARRDAVHARVNAARERVRAAGEAARRLRAGARREEVDAARARVSAVDAQTAIWQKAVADATITAPVSGIVTETIADVGEIVQPRSPIAVITDLDHAWADVYVDEPSVPRVRLGQTVAVFTDAGGPGIPGTVSYISDKAEFTPRNVQTAEDRSKLVYRVKVSVDNKEGVLKTGMPVEAEIPLAPLAK
jgi:HlyD family secretion protein